MSDNAEKQGRYATLKNKLRIAVEKEFWFEACMIEYAIMEDRTSSILQHARVCKNAYASKKTLANKLSSIEQRIAEKHPIISKKVDVNTIIAIREWKNERNDLVHKSCLVYDEEKAKEIAKQGYDLVKSISNQSAKVSRLSNKIYIEQNI